MTGALATSRLEEAALKAATLVDALPYIREYRGCSVVVKVGGDLLDDVQRASVLAHDLALLSFVGIRIVVVHGGGPQVTRAMQAVGLEPTFVSGLRVTDPAVMDAVRQVLVGSINPAFVSLLREAGSNAFGLSGLDGGLIQAALATGPNGEELGRVGRVASVEPQVVADLLDAGYTPVVASVATDPSGTFLNINADAVAGALAGEMKAAKLVYLTNVEGLYKDLGDSGSLIAELKMGELAAMLPSLSPGIRPKAEGAVDALARGVGKVHVLDGRVEHALLLEIFTAEGVGTQVLP